MNQTNQLQGESHSNLLFKEKVFENQTKIFEDLKERKNQWSTANDSQIKNNGEI